MTLTRFGTVFVVLAAAAVAGVVYVPWWPAQAVLVCTAVSLVIVGTAYLAAAPKLMMKSGRGTLPLASWILLWPFRLVAMTLNMYHRFSGEPAWTEIVPRLYVGRRLWGREAEGMEAGRVLDLTCEMAENRRLRVRPGYHCLPVLDNGCPTVAELEAGATWLAENLREGPVYVHCAAGHGRSATLVLAYLLAGGKVADMREGLALLKARRPKVHINRCQRAVLEAFVARGARRW